MWTWSRGGGWLGPNLKNEFWCEQNTDVMAKWGQDPHRSEEEKFNELTLRKGVSETNLPKFREISLLSTKAVLRGKHSKYCVGYSVVWTRDEFIYGAGMLKAFFDRVIKEGLVEKVLNEKKEITTVWKRIVELSEQIKTTDKDLNEFLITSAEYGRIKYEIYEMSWIVMLLGHIGDKTGVYEEERIRMAITRYDVLWQERKRLEKNSPSCASIYLPEGFGNDG